MVALNLSSSFYEPRFIEAPSNLSSSLKNSFRLNSSFLFELEFTLGINIQSKEYK